MMDINRPIVNVTDFLLSRVLLTGYVRLRYTQRACLLCVISRTNMFHCRVHNTTRLFRGHHVDPWKYVVAV